MYGPLDPRGLRGPAESRGLVGRFHSQTHQAVIDLFPWSPPPLQEASTCLGPPVSPGHRRVHPRYSHDSPEIETGLRGRVGGGEGPGSLAKGSLTELCPQPPTDHVKGEGCTPTLKGPTSGTVPARSDQDLPGKRQWPSQELQGERIREFVSSPNSVRGWGKTPLKGHQRGVWASPGSCDLGHSASL